MSRHIRNSIDLFERVTLLPVGDIMLDDAMEELLASFDLFGSTEKRDSNNVALFQKQRDEIQTLLDTSGEDYCRRLYSICDTYPPSVVECLLPVYMLRHILHCQKKEFTYRGSVGFTRFVKRWKDVII